MTDPQNAFEVDNVTFPNTTDETELASPAISVSPVASDSQRRVSATNQQKSAFSSSELQRSTELAYDTNVRRSPDHNSGSLNYALDTPSLRVLDTDTTHGLATSLNIDSHAAASSGLVLANFGNQPWKVQIAGPFLDFAPQPFYEPTGQLIHEPTQAFDHFDNPANIWPSTNSPTDSGSRRPPDPSTSRSLERADSKLVDVFRQPALPRSALKRKADSLTSPTTDSEAAGKSQAQSARPAKPRAVSFERMSGLGPTSPDGGSASSDHPSAHNRGDSSTSNRRTRQTAVSTPRVGGNAQTPQQSARANRGTRPPSGHPPSILQPERVFPIQVSFEAFGTRCGADQIQIGSELFRLSGASISSDGEAF